MDILIKNIDLRGVLLLTPKAIFKPVEEYDHEKIVQKWEIVKEAEIVPVPEHGDLIDRQGVLVLFDIAIHTLKSLHQDTSNLSILLESVKEVDVVMPKSGS